MIAAAAAGVVRRLDSWVNALTGLGGVRDKITAAQPVAGCKLADSTLEALFNDDDIAARIVAAVPKAATRRGFCVELKGDDPDESAQTRADIEAALRALHVLTKLRAGWIWGRLYGAGAVFLGIDDGQDPSQPVNELAIRSIRFLNVVPKPGIQIYQRYADVASPKYGEPELYAFNGAGTGRAMMAPVRSDNILIHESRLLMFGGGLTARVFTPSLDGFDDSVLQRVYDVLRSTNTVWQSVAHLMTDASQGVLKIADLVSLIASGGQSDLRTRMELMDMSRSVCRSILIDAEREDFTRVATSFAGIPELLDRIMLRTASAAEMPATELWGRAPAGMNATGEADTRSWYDTVEAAQTDVLAPQLERLIKLVLLAKDGPTRGVEPERWELKFTPLWQETAKERADRLKVRAETHATLVREQIMLDVEAALALADEFPTINTETRLRALEAELEALEEHAGERPELDPDPNTDDPNADPKPGD